MSEPRTSKIIKSVRRVYNVGKYESLEVQVSYEEDVVWTSVSERCEKSNSITKLLLADFVSTKETFFNSMQLKAVTDKVVKNVVKDNSSLEQLGLDDL